MQHGFNEVQVELEGNLVICIPDGAFNLEGVQEYEVNFAKQIANFKGQKWGILNIYDTYETGGPEVQERVTTQFKWSVKNGCAFIGFVVHNPLHEYAAKHTTKGLNAEVKIFHKDKVEAFKWIREALANANQTA